ncbi:Serine/threonine-protein kinase ssp1 [Diplogelasinospora grovesii]|uniref:non-specific serine/threonine protein kinase n=1 Tax=Diplogelasinospora grovesii TaxID=303347 RepID=A0AAN6NEW7_9PEZI|nr:Serine/threonine-protein kinase ssp1 [Diplogelasinospora grovesii]
MEPQQPHPQSRPSHPHLHNILPPPLSQPPYRTSNSTPVSSPGLFSPSLPRPNMSLASQPGSEGTTPLGATNSPYLHPLQSHRVRETHKANVEHDYTTGRKLINHYEIIEELGRGMHGKVKLARNLETGENVAIKIIPRFSKKRRLGKVTAMSTQDKSKREIAILKKIRHPNIVALLEIIDDPELKKIYMVLEHVELGEIVWRKKGIPRICAYERRRIEREMRGEQPTPEEEEHERLMQQRQAINDAKRAKIAQHWNAHEYWSLEHGAPEDEDIEAYSRSLSRDGIAENLARSLASNPGSLDGSRATSRAPSRTQSMKSTSRAGTPHPHDADMILPIPDEDDLETPGPLRSNPASSTALDGTMYGPYVEDPTLRGRSPSMADSIISHMSSVDYNKVHDPYADDYSYVPCFTIDKARQTFRDTVLGLEYLHYEGVVHRDIKPANLLWTKDHRVKIADFGVSYFGRPVRPGEPDETISESEARDFDNDLELAKTVGTPAFFAPELCYTDAYDDRVGPTPKINEQIDVWSLGVTLYCLLFARIPFLAEDEWQMFRKIATEDCYIPRRRLRPVDPSTKPDEKSLYTRVNRPPYRHDDELAYEEIDRDLHDLLTKMLTRNPEKRIRLRDVKRHPWVTKDINNVVAWLDDTDPSRRTSGRKIQVDEREVARAVVPLTFLERARSAVKKAVGKVMHPRGDRGESVSSRRRAASSAASSAGESPVNGASTPHPRDARRKSLRPDDYFATVKEYPQSSGEHPLTQSVTASPHEMTFQEASMPPHSSSFGGHSARQMLELAAGLSTREDFTNQHPPVSVQRGFTRHTHSRSITNAFLPLTHGPGEVQTMPPTPLFDGTAHDPSSTLRKARDMRPTSDESSRARSVDRGLFASSDKRAEAKVALSTAVAPGNVHFSPTPRPRRPTDLVKGFENAVLPLSSGVRPLSRPSSPLTGSPLTGYQHGQPKSEPNIQEKRRSLLDQDERPSTAHRVGDMPDAKPCPPRVHAPITIEPSARAQAQADRRQVREHEEEVRRQERENAESALEIEPALVPCPPSPDEDIFVIRPFLSSRAETIGTALSSSSTSMGALTTPLTSPSDTTSPICGANLSVSREAADQILAFQSDPSLPALLSSTSSVSADLEGEFLGNPGVVGRPSVIDTTDSLTPRALQKEPLAGFPLEDHEQVMQGAVPVRLDAGAGRPPNVMSAMPVVSRNQHDDDDDESDSDEGLTMAKRKKSHNSNNHNLSKDINSIGRLVGGARRRNTNASVGSAETAKKLIEDSD